MQHKSITLLTMNKKKFNKYDIDNLSTDYNFFMLNANTDFQPCQFKLSFKYPIPLPSSHFSLKSRIKDGLAWGVSLNWNAICAHRTVGSI
jgi:hypothetical protein